MFCNFSYKKQGADRLNEEYQRLVKGLKEAQLKRETDVILANPILPNDILKGNIISLHCIAMQL